MHYNVISCVNHVQANYLGASSLYSIDFVVMYHDYMADMTAITFPKKIIQNCIKKESKTEKVNYVPS